MFSKKDEFSSEEYLYNLNGYFRAANYLSAAQLYLKSNPLLKEPLKEEDVKTKIVGHWGTVPGQNFVYAHLNRVINKFDANMILISGPGHGGNFFLSNSYLEGRYSEVYPNIGQDEEGLTKFCKQFSFPGGVSSHVAPETPGSIHEGGELGYSLAHAFGAVLDNPNLIAATIVGDGEAETGPLATSWHGNKFINPNSDGVVLPILHLNGYKISNPTMFSRLSKKEVKNFFRGCGWKPYFVEGHDPIKMHKLMAKTMDKCMEQIAKIKKRSKNNPNMERPIYPMIVLRTPKGWTGPKVVDNEVIEGTFRAHQVPITMQEGNHLDLLKDWLQSYNPDELFDENYKLRKKFAQICPIGNKRISANPNCNGGNMLVDLRLPNLTNYAIDIKAPGAIQKQDTLELSAYLRDLYKLNTDTKNFRLWCPDEAKSNRLYHIFEGTDRAFNAKILKTDESVSRSGRIMDSYLSEHLCEGMLEGYLLTGRHGMFATYEAFARVIDSMVSQHAKWLKTCNGISWRAPISSLNILLTSYVWQQDHNGYSHQEPGFLNLLANKKPEIVRAYLPADANTLIYCFDHIVRTKNRINAVVASKHPSYQWLSFEEAKKHFEKGASVWDFATNDNGEEPDLVIAGCGSTPTLEALAAVTILRDNFKDIKIRFVNVVDLFKLQNKNIHPHGLTDKEYNNLFTKNKPIIFAFHGYPNLIYDLTRTRENKNMEVFGYMEEGTITTSFDIRVQNHIDRFHLVLKALEKLNLDKDKTKALKTEMEDLLNKHKDYIKEYGKDIKEVTDWKWHLPNKK